MEWQEKKKVGCLYGNSRINFIVKGFRILQSFGIDILVQSMR